MALKLLEIFKNGIEGEYWRIGAISFTKVGDQQFNSQADLHLWKDQSITTQTNATPIKEQYNHKGFDFDNIVIDDLNLNSGATLSEAMKKAVYLDIKAKAAEELLKDEADRKEIAKFANAIDV